MKFFQSLVVPRMERSLEIAPHLAGSDPTWARRDHLRTRRPIPRGPPRAELKRPWHATMLLELSLAES